MTRARRAMEISDCSSTNLQWPWCNNMTKMPPRINPCKSGRPLCKTTSRTCRPWPRRPTPVPSPSCPWLKPPFLVKCKWLMIIVIKKSLMCKNLMMEISLIKANQNIRSQWKISKKIAQPPGIKMTICLQSIASNWNSKSFACCSGWWNCGEKWQMTVSSRTPQIQNQVEGVE